mmetsp:Transcript_11886/g.34096  ORF Transcript_11886/g.34096 Transcript_11886/m.34096 type:complete len:238 (+) Transcript_11886:318-1031(+)
MAMGRPAVGRNVDSRTRLLNSLGLFQEQQQREESKCYPREVAGLKKDGRDASPPNGHTENIGSSSYIEKKKIRHVKSLSDIPVRSALHNTVAFQTILNDENVTRPRRSSFSDKDKNKKDRSPHSVRFNTVVCGVKIPSRNQYSRRIRQTLWRDRYELSEMVERNTTEFHAENYDWNQVVLDEEMYVDATSGERVHPCHVEGHLFDDTDEDEDDYDDSFGDGLEFSPLSRSESMLGSK